jgi:uncharacterized protein YbjT (DUF2867 family)
MSGIILVTGATGNVGSEVVRHLLRLGCSVRTATPDPERARALVGLGAEHVRFDFGDPATFEPAFAGAEAFFLVRPPPVSDVERVMGPAIRFAAQKPGRHAVFLSVMGAGMNPLVPHHTVERLIRRCGLPFTFLRPSFFMQNLSTVHRAEIRDHDEIFVPAGRGRTSFIDVRDIGEVAARVLGNPAHLGWGYTLTGSEALDYFQVAEIFSRVLGRPIHYTNPTNREFRQRLAENGVAPDLARVMGNVYRTARLRLAGHITPDTQRLLGRAPITMEQFVSDHAALWSRVPTPQPEEALL